MQSGGRTAKVGDDHLARHRELAANGTRAAAKGGEDEAEWRAQLTPEQFEVARLKGTERPFSSEMCSLFEPGKYACICCGEALFDSGEKFESGSGWPSFTQPLATEAIAYTSDHSHGMMRVEATCNVCGAHLGHVFPDGPKPSGLRYCINAGGDSEGALNSHPDAKSVNVGFGLGLNQCPNCDYKNTPAPAAPTLDGRGRPPVRVRIFRR